MKKLRSENKSIAKINDFIPQNFYDDFWSDTELKMKELLKEMLQTALVYEA